MSLDEYLADRGRLVEEWLAAWVERARPDVEPRLLEAMAYSLLSGGKRIRPVLLLAAGESVGAPAPLLPFACAVEMIHTYSLIHDDLPSMDDDPMRRGKPSNHVVFGDGVATLAGDALLTEAFAVMSGAGAPADVTLRSVLELATAAGAAGMVGGQTADLLAVGTGADRARVESIHRRKTGALLRASIRIGALVARAHEDSLDRLSRYGESLGLAFQIADDLLDEAGNLAATGKESPRDRERGKSTYPGALGVQECRAILRRLLADTLGAIEPLGSRAEPLRAIARSLIARAL